MSLILVTGPTVEPVSTAEAKSHLRVDSSDDDTLIAALVTAARQHLDGRDGWLNRALVTQTWDLHLAAFPDATRGNPAAAIRVPLPPLQSVTSISYIDAAGATQTLAGAGYTVSGVGALGPGAIEPSYGNSWPATRDVPEAVTVRFVAGYASGESPEDASAVPQPVKQAILLLVGHWYANREAVNVGNIVSELPMAVEALLAPYRVTWFS